MKMTGAELVIRLLERQGIRLIAGIPGGANLPLYDALARRPVIQHILARHEQGAGFIAQGLARTTGQAAVCFATSGPGATNAITAIADAKLDSIPVICISGQVPSNLIGTDAFQEVDIFGMSLSITKHNYLVQSVEELLDTIPEAFRIATSGRPGPVWIDIPKDIQNASIEFETWPEIGTADPRIEPESNAIEEAARMIEAAERPMLYLGGGVIHSEASTQAKALAERSHLPTVNTLMAMGALPTDHPQNLGMLGMHAAPYTNLALRECDLLIAIGARFDDRATGKVTEFCPNAKVIHIDIDSSELGKIRQPTLSICADVGSTLDQLLPKLTARTRRAWNERIKKLQIANPINMPGLEDASQPYGLIKAVARHAGRDAIIATDVGQHQMWTAQAFPFTRPRQWLTSGGLGTMGFGLPSALGAALTDPDETVVCISGDGSFLMNNQEMITAAEEGADLKIVLMNNQTLGLVHQQQSLFYGKRLSASRFKQGPDFAMMARSMGIQAIDLAEEPDIDAALARAFAIKGPVLIHAPICAEQQVLPMVAPGGANHEMIRHPENGDNAITGTN
jgi:acetolactate synthase-1/2/3 large subunit